MRGFDEPDDEQERGEGEYDEKQILPKLLALMMPFALMLGGLFGYIALRFQQAMSTNVPGSGGSFALEGRSNFYLGLAASLAILCPLLTSFILERDERPSIRGRVLGFFGVCGAIWSFFLVVQTLVYGQDMLPVALDYLSSEAYWLLPLTMLSAILASAIQAEKRKNAGYQGMIEHKSTSD